MYKTKCILYCCLALFASLAALACTEAPFEPITSTTEGYKVYFQSENNVARWYTYNPETDLLDSLSLSTPLGRQCKISPNGDKLYLSRMAGYGSLVIDLETKELIIDLTYTVRSLDLSPDGNLLAIRYNGLTLVNTDDWSLLFRDSLWPVVSSIAFSNDGSRITGSYNDSYGWCTVADPSNVTEEIAGFDGHAMFGGRVLSSPPGDHWYLYSANRYFIDWDRNADRAVFVDTARHSYSTHPHHITNDGNYVAYMHDRYSLIPVPHQYTEIKIYDTQSHTIVDRFEPTIYPDSGGTIYLAVDEIVITPDSKWLIGITHHSASHIVVYNLETLKIERYVEVPGGHGLFNLVCQTGE